MRSSTLKNRLIINTRPLHQAAALTALLQNEGASVFEFPTLEITPAAEKEWVEFEDALHALKSSDWILFTSANGVEQTQNYLNSKPDLSALFSIPSIAAIGEKTAASLRGFAHQPSFAGTQGACGINSESFAKEFLSHLENEKLPIANALLLRGGIASEALPERLQQAGFQVSCISVYSSAPPAVPPRDIKQLFKHLDSDLSTLVFTSSEAAKNFFQILGNILSIQDRDWKSQVLQWQVAVIGPKTRAAVEKLGFRDIISSSEQSIESLVQALCRHYSS